MKERTAWLVSAATVSAVIVFYSLFLSGAGPAQQAQASLQITSPPDGTIVVPGQTINVVVSLSPGARFTLISVIGQSPLGWAVQTSAGPTFSFTIPKNISLGKYSVSAIGSITPGTNVFSPAIILNVENPTLIGQLSAEPDAIFFEYAGQQKQLRIVGSFVDGTGGEITESRNITFSSDNLSVAVVSNGGQVTAIGSGTTNIVVHYRDKSLNIAISIPKTIKGDLNGDGKVDQDDVNVIRGALFGVKTESGTPATSVPATGPFDARDLNGDGRIDLQDAKLLANLCTANCATINIPPDVSQARPSLTTLWPPNHKLVPVSILGVTDPDGGPATVRIDQIRQDEPTSGLGAGDTCPDGQGLGASDAQLRAERSGTGNGRVYTVFFTATDGRGGSSRGTVQVCVPHDQGGSCQFTGFRSKPSRDSTTCSP